MSNGFVKRRRGILEHLQEGRITLLEAGAHDMIGMLADKCTGIWFGSARAFAANCGSGDVSERQARHLLESLETKGYIRRFTRPRAHGNYPILINKYEVTFGAHAGMRLNASETVDWRNPVYEKCLEHGAERGLEHGAKVAPSQEVDLRSDTENTAVRRTAENCVRLGSSPSFKKTQKAERLKAHLAAKIAKDGERVQDFNWTQWQEDIHKVFDALLYKPDWNSPDLSASFLVTAVEVYEEAAEKGGSIARGNLCSKIIDRCVQRNKEYPDEGYYWPPDFQEHRDRLREAERRAERAREKPENGSAIHPATPWDGDGDPLGAELHAISGCRVRFSPSQMEDLYNLGFVEDKIEAEFRQFLLKVTHKGKQWERAYRDFYAHMKTLATDVGQEKAPPTDPDDDFPLLMSDAEAEARKKMLKHQAAEASSRDASGLTPLERERVLERAEVIA